MKFDVIIGNPPYQQTQGLEGGNKFSATALYHEFISLAKNLNPTYISMIIPSRWMTGIAKGIPKEWVIEFMNDKLVEIHDFEDYLDIFDGVGVSGGICYFLWDKNAEENNVKYYFHTKRKEIFTRQGKLDYYNINSVIRNPKMHSIINKVIEIEGKDYYLDNKNFSSLVSAKGIFTHGSTFTTNWKSYKEEKDDDNNIKYYISALYNKGLSYAWVNPNDIIKRQEVVNKHKIFISSAYGDPLRYDSVINLSFYGEPGSICSQTYVTIGDKEDFTETQCMNIISYINTKFFRFLVRTKNTTQDAARGVYQFVPIQNYDKPWSDTKLYDKYKLTNEEINYIESVIPDLNL